nr:Chain A, PawS Derived Peptide 5 (PDP-5) [unidentified]
GRYRRCIPGMFRAYCYMD